MSSNLETKRLRIWEKGKPTNVIAIRAEGVFCTEVLGPHPRVILIRLYDMKAGWESFSTWTQRGLIVTHKDLETNWIKYKDGQDIFTDEVRP